MLGSFPLAFSYALRVTKVIHRGGQHSLRQKWVARLAFGLAVVGALWSTLYVVLELFFPLEA